MYPNAHEILFFNTKKRVKDYYIFAYNYKFYFKPPRIIHEIYKSYIKICIIK